MTPRTWSAEDRGGTTIGGDVYAGSAGATRVICLAISRCTCLRLALCLKTSATEERLIMDPECSLPMFLTLVSRLLTGAATNLLILIDEPFMVTARTLIWGGVNLGNMLIDVRCRLTRLTITKVVVTNRMS